VELLAYRRLDTGEERAFVGCGRLPEPSIYYIELE